MRQGTFIFIGFIFFALLSSCATMYQPSSFSGGYSDTQMAPDVFRVNFAGNGYTSSERSQDFTLLRASELTLQNGFKYFAIINESNTTKIDSYTTQGSSYTSGTAYVNGGYGSYSSTTTYNPPQTYNFHKPRSSLIIQCYADKPDSVFTFDATYIQRSIKQKYNIQ